MSLSLRDAIAKTSNGKAIIVQAEKWAANVAEQRKLTEEQRRIAEEQRLEKAAKWDARVAAIKTALHTVFVTDLPRGYSRQWGWDMYKKASRLPAFVAADDQETTEGVVQALQFCLFDSGARKEIRYWITDPVGYARDMRCDSAVEVDGSDVKAPEMLDSGDIELVLAPVKAGPARDSRGRFLPKSKPVAVAA
jgi:hypothetical protein